MLLQYHIVSKDRRQPDIRNGRTAAQQQRGQ